MNYFKRLNIIIPIIVLGGMYIFGIIATNIEDDAISIGMYTADITIDSSGDMRVIETWDMTYEEALRVRFRDIDYIKYPDNYPLFSSSTNIANFDYQNVSVQIFKDGIDVTDDITVGYSFDGDRDELGKLVSCEPIRMNCESIFTDFKNVGGLEGNITFVYDYTINGVVTQYLDTSELNWILFEYAESSIENGEITIHLPNNTNNLNDYYIWSHGIDNTTTSISSNDLIKITFKDMKTKDILDFRLLVPTNVFDDIADINKVIYNQIKKQVILDYEQTILDHEEKGNEIETLFIYLPFIVAAIMTIITFILHKLFFVPYKTNFTDDIYRELPSNHSPAVIGYLYRYKKTVSEDITATVLDLVRKDYLSLNDTLAYESTDDFDLIIELDRSRDLKLLLPHERYLIEWFIKKIGNGLQVTTKEIENYGSDSLQARTFQGKVKRFKELVKEEAMKNEFFDKKIDDHKKIAHLFTIIPIALLVGSLVLYSIYGINLIISYIVSIIVIILYQVFVNTRKLRSEEGQELYNKWKAYNNYLLQSDELKTYNMSSVDFWEHSIIYATTFGFADRVMEQLSVKLPMTEEIARESKYLGVGYKHTSYRYGHFIHTMNYSYKKAYRASVARSYRSSGSGRSGGGSFGGGGGGGRSR